MRTARTGISACGLALFLWALAGAADAPPSPGTPGAAWETCAQCHAEVTKGFGHTPHGASPAGCQGCHGPTDAHVEAGGDPTKIRRMADMSGREISDTCLTCHQRGDVAHWVGSEHDRRKLDCTTCHVTHPRGPVPAKLLRNHQLQQCGSCHAQQQAKMFRSAHMPVREGKMNCTSCHNPHGGPNEKLLQQHSTNENCYSCHMEKRGPFLWDHAPVRENCASCHDPHGSINENMLKVRQPILCQTCHVGTRHPSTTHMAPSKFAFNHACLNCHPMVHGSNHPSGHRFMR